MTFATTILAAVVGAAFLAAGAQKLAGAERQTTGFARFGYPRWSMYAIGALELAGAVGLFVGAVVPPVTLLAGLLLAVVMAGAVATHLRLKDPVGSLAPSLTLLVLSLVVSAAVAFA